MMNLIFIFLSVVAMHPLHLGVIHIDMAEQGQSNLVVRVFTNDLEHAIAAADNNAFAFNYNDKSSVARGTSYVLEKLSIMQNGQQIEPEFLKVARRDDATEFTFELTLNSLTGFSVCGTIFHELFTDQTNLVIVKTKTSENGNRLTTNNPCVDV
ncbi:MAG: hypothetical protein PF489_07795 [Salinivirgaceae bacterium]|jgi:hypothetical protein|nr:hypothetical protein [Salinivirgaceae bacterium]